MDYRSRVMTSFLGAGGLVSTGDLVSYPVGKKWYGGLKYADFVVGRITGYSVVLMSDIYGVIEVARGEAVMYTKDNGRAKERILDKIADYETQSNTNEKE